MDYINAFWVGGLICALAQILMEKTKMLPGRIISKKSLVRISSACSGVRIFGFLLSIVFPFCRYSSAMISSLPSLPEP